MTILTEKENVGKLYIKALNLEKKAAAFYESKDGKTRLTWAQGHLYTLFDAEDYAERYKTWKGKDLPIIPETLRTKPIKEKAHARKACEEVLRKAKETHDEIVVATDPDREGEVIGRFILEKLGIDIKTCSRVWALEGLNRDEILKNLENRKPLENYDDLYLKGRRHKESDWLLGINLTRCYSVINRELFSVGRVQTALLKKIYEREREILTFLPVKVYEGKVQLESETGTVEDSFLINPEDGKTVFKSRDAIKNLLPFVPKELICKNTESEKKSEKAPKLYDLNGLQVDASRLYGISVDKTLEVAQKLYNEMGKLSYPRTDSRYMGEEDYELFVKLMDELSEKDGRFDVKSERIKPDNPDIFNDKKKKAHHALIPTEFFENDGESLEGKVFDLVLRRFLMQGMKPYEYENEKAYFTNNKVTFVSEGKKISEKGWKDAEILLKKENVSEIFFVSGKTYKVKGFEIVEKLTEGPRRFTQSTLIKFMNNPFSDRKDLTIGTQSTQSSIIRTLFSRGYIREEKKNIYITEKGVKLVEQIVNNKVLDSMTDVVTTNEWEVMLEENPEGMIENTKNEVRKAVEAVRKDMDVVMEKSVVCKCPSCGGDILRGRQGYYCSGFKEKGCENKVSFNVMGNEITEDMVKDIFSGKEMNVLNGVKKDGSKTSFRFVLNDNRIGISWLNLDLDINCPLCSSALFETKKVFKCTNKECSFFLYKETSGLKFDADIVRKLIAGETVRMVKKEKDGNESQVDVTYNNGNLGCKRV